MLEFSAFHPALFDGRAGQDVPEARLAGEAVIKHHQAAAIAERAPALPDEEREVHLARHEVALDEDEAVEVE
ncbi:MAG TPA: hypothetical protein VM223_28350 [Planctomycetota bacterium]|nr:hypothetical protein [Planctomycetota bacterium]